MSPSIIKCLFFVTSFILSINSYSSFTGCSDGIVTESTYAQSKVDNENSKFLTLYNSWLKGEKLGLSVSLSEIKKFVSLNPNIQDKENFKNFYYPLSPKWFEWRAYKKTKIANLIMHRLYIIKDDSSIFFGENSLLNEDNLLFLFLHLNFSSEDNIDLKEIKYSYPISDYALVSGENREVVSPQNLLFALKNMPQDLRSLFLEKIVENNAQPYSFAMNSSNQNNIYLIALFYVFLIEQNYDYYQAFYNLYSVKSEQWISTKIPYFSNETEFKASSISYGNSIKEILLSYAFSTRGFFNTNIEFDSNKFLKANFSAWEFVNWSIFQFDDILPKFDLPKKRNYIRAYNILNELYLPVHELFNQAKLPFYFNLRPDNETYIKQMFDSPGFTLPGHIFTSFDQLKNDLAGPETKYHGNGTIEISDKASDTIIFIVTNILGDFISPVFDVKSPFFNKQLANSIQFMSIHVDPNDNVRGSYYDPVEFFVFPETDSGGKQKLMSIDYYLRGSSLRVQFYPKFQILNHQGQIVPNPNGRFIEKAFLIPFD